MEKKYEYYAYRYFVIDIDPRQRSLLGILAIKNNFFPNIFIKLIDNKKIEIVSRGRKYLLYYTKDINKSIFITKFAKETHHLKFIEGKEDIETAEDKNFPFIYIIFNLTTQTLLIQKKTTVFSTPFSAKNILEDFFSNLLRDNDLTFKVDEITYKEKFWEIIRSAEKIYSLQLNLKSPNFFRGRYKANELLEELRKLYNNTEVDFQVKNDEGKLKLLRENLEDFIHYIAEGGGKYIINIMQNGIIHRILSKINIKKYFLKDLKEEESEKIISIFNKIDEDE